MSNLSLITDTLSRVASAIQAALGVHVTIVDKTFSKLVSTKTDDTAPIDQGSANALTLKTGNLLFIDTPREHPACDLCGSKHACKEFAEVCAPILHKGKVEGVIGLVAFDEDQRTYLLSHKEGVITFLNQMSELIAVKLKEHQDHETLVMTNQELDLLISKMDHGVVYTDCKGHVKRCNTYVSAAFNIKQGDKLPPDWLDHDGQASLLNQTFVWRGHEPVRGVYDRHLIADGRVTCGYVFFIETLKSSISRYQALDAQPMLTHFESIAGESLAIRSAILIGAKAAKTSSTVLIQGESGTGKELFARAIHNHSPRANKAFVAINCGAIPEHLLESELFGYEPGAFTGASKQGRPGKFELAEGGTLFLDEIGDMPLNLQVKLLRVLQERTVERLGGGMPTPIDVRIICATHQALEQMVAQGEFREDLYYRIQVLPITVPPLRDRIEDLPHLIANIMVQKKNRLGIIADIHLDDQVMDMMKKHPWQGNVRELENVIEYALNVDNDHVISQEDLPQRFFTALASSPSPLNFKSLAQMEQDMITMALNHFGQDKAGIERVCQVLGISRATLYRKIKK